MFTAGPHPSLAFCFLNMCDALIWRRHPTKNRRFGKKSVWMVVKAAPSAACVTSQPGRCGARGLSAARSGPIDPRDQPPGVGHLTRGSRALGDAVATGSFAGEADLDGTQD